MRNWNEAPFYLGFPGGASGKEPVCQCRRQKRRGFDPWVRKISWRRAWQPIPVLLPGEPHGQRSLVAAGHRVTQIGTCLKWLSTHTPFYLFWQKRKLRHSLPKWKTKQPCFYFPMLPAECSVAETNTPQAEDTHMSPRMVLGVAPPWRYPGFRAWICARKAFSEVGDGTRSSNCVRANSESTLLSVSLPTSIRYNWRK